MIRPLRTLVLTAALAGCTAMLFAVPAQYDTVTVVLPAGNSQAGRRAFLALRCTVCHRVEGEGTFPAPLAESQGPDLNRVLASWSASDVAAAITVPSHSMSVRTSEAVKKQLQQMLQSPMPDYSRAMTVRQLSDLVAYLHSIGPAR
jgi:mono/diheme cytochrome c family protein